MAFEGDRPPALARPRFNDSHSPFLPWLIGALLAVATIGPTANAWFGIIDDHWIVKWLGPRHAMTLSDVWHALRASDIGTFGKVEDRYRPTFFAYWILETALFGDHAWLYHVARIGFFAAFLGSMICLARKALGLVVASTATVLFALEAFWGDIWAYSLGVIEQLAALAFSIAALGYGAAVAALLERRRLGRGAVIALSLGTAMAVGCKENFVFLVLPFAVVLVALYRARSVQAADLGVAAPFLAFSVLCVVVVASITLANSTDYYGADASLRHRISAVFAAPAPAAFAMVALIAAPAVARVAMRRSTLERARLSRTAIAFLVSIVLLCTYILWELAVYNGRLQAHSRYDFPLQLLLMLVIGAFGGFLATTFPRRARRWRAASLVFLCLSTMSEPPGPRIVAVPRAAKAKADRSQRFRAALDDMSRVAALQPTWPIVLQALGPWDYEVMATFHVWHAFSRIANPVALRMSIPAGAIQSPFEAHLANAMSTWASQGVPGRFIPFQQAEPFLHDGRCFATSRPDEALSRCRPLQFLSEDYRP
jgi:hypothetical protein